jgi:hypothetical protein
VDFTTPVAITANTVYVASYHTNVGHYSENQNYFATAGFDSPPLHALANGVSGGNGVYAYGAGSVFPTQSFNTTNYWVDMAFSPGPQSLSIATTSLPGGTMGIAYSATLAASGVTPSYTWSITNGSLPTGLGLNASTGAITGTPTVAGISTFTVQVNDSSSATASRSLSITIAPTNTGLRVPSANAPETSNAGDNNGFQTTPTNAYGDGGGFAVDTNSGNNISTSCIDTGKDKHRYYNYGINLPVGSTINGIEVRLDARADSTTGAPMMCVQLSWDGGTTWTAAKNTATLTTSEATYTLGGIADTWGHTWNTGIGELSNANFRVRVIDVASNNSRDFSLDWVAVRVTYQ